MNAETFNAKYPVGTRFNYHSLVRGAKHQPTQTRSEAWEISPGVAVVKVNGMPGCVAVASLTVGCRDQGACHHQCGAGPCFREESCAPLSVTGVSDWKRIPKTAVHTELDAR